MNALLINYLYYKINKIAYFEEAIKVNIESLLLLSSYVPVDHLHVPHLGEYYPGLWFNLEFDVFTIDLLGWSVLYCALWSSEGSLGVLCCYLV